MKKILLALLIGLFCVASTATASIFVANEINQIFYNNFENVYDSDGNVVQYVGQGFNEGDHLVGIISVQNIDAGGSTVWNSNAGVEEITGVFAQQVINVYEKPNDPLDAAQDTFDHLVLGAPDPTFISNFSTVQGIDLTSVFTGDVMFSLYYDTGATAFSYGGATVAADITVAIDGSHWMDLGYDDNGTNPGFGDTDTADLVDDDGYFYSHADTTQTLANLVGEAFGGLQILYNGTGFEYVGDLNDINENEMDGIIPGLLNDFITTSEFEANPDYVGFGGFSQWAFASNDPARIHPVPEPSTMLLLGAGLLGLLVYRRKRN